MTSRAAPLLLLLACAACPPLDDDDSSAAPWDDDDATLDDDDATLEPRWSSLHPMLNFRCGCHRTNENGDGGLIGMEDPDLIYGRLVGVPSEDVPSMNRIEPGDPERSYLFMKITSRQLTVGGAGRRMPPTGVALKDEQIEAIRGWILGGAGME